MFVLFRIIRKIYVMVNIQFMKISGLKVGAGTSFTGNPNFGSEPYLIKIGQNCTIAGSVSFITHDGAMRVLGRKFNQRFSDRIYFGDIRIGNNCFIGYNSTIMPGVKIGDNCIVGAESLVNKDLPANGVYAGVPARYIMSLEEYADKMTEKSWTVQDKEYFKKHKRDYLVKYFRMDD